MEPDRYQRVKAVFVEVGDLEGAAREARLAELCGDDADLRHEVEELLGFDEGAPVLPPESPAEPVHAPEEPRARRLALPAILVALAVVATALWPKGSAQLVRYGVLSRCTGGFASTRELRLSPAAGLAAVRLETEDGTTEIRLVDLPRGTVLLTLPRDGALGEFSADGRLLEIEGPGGDKARFDLLRGDFLGETATRETPASTVAGPGGPDPVALDLGDVRPTQLDFEGNRLLVATAEGDLVLFEALPGGVPEPTSLAGKLLMGLGSDPDMLARTFERLEPEERRATLLEFLRHRLR